MYDSDRKGRSCVSSVVMSEAFQKFSYRLCVRTDDDAARSMAAGLVNVVKNNVIREKIPNRDSNNVEREM